MKLTGAIACVIVATNCAEKANGTTSQTLLSADALWVWWIVAVLWLYAGLRLLVSD